MQKLISSLQHPLRPHRQTQTSATMATQEEAAPPDVPELEMPGLEVQELEMPELEVEMPELEVGMPEIQVQLFVLPDGSTCVTIFDNGIATTDVMRVVIVAHRVARR